MRKMNQTIDGVKFRRGITGYLYGVIADQDIVARNFNYGALPWVISRAGYSLTVVSRGETLRSAIAGAKEQLERA